MLVLSFSANRGAAQDRSLPHGLTIGETVPDIFWTKAFKGITFSEFSKPVPKLNTFKLDKFRGKLIILDFWATYCAPCIHGFPNMKYLQEKFSNQIEIIQVNNEFGDKPVTLLQNRFKEHNELFSNIFSDSLLYKLFPFKTIPHYVWINGAGKFIAATGSEEIDSLKISNVLHGGQENFINKLNIDTDRHLFTTKDLPVSNLVKYNILLKGYLSGLGTGTSFKIDSATKVITGQTITNMPLKKLFSMIGHQIFKAERKIFSDKRVVYNGKRQNDIASEIYNYEFDVPLFMAPDLYRLMINDLNTYSPYVATFEKRYVPCLFLERTTSKSDLVNLGGTEKQIKTLANPSGQMCVVRITNYPADVLAMSLENSKFIKLPVVDSTGSANPISVQIDYSGDVNDQLKKFGLRLREGMTTLDLMVINDQSIILKLQTK